MIQQAEILEYAADAAAKRRQVAAPRRGQFLAEKRDKAPRRRLGEECLRCSGRLVHRMLNLFNRQALVNQAQITTTVLTRSNQTRYAAFNPFTTKPVECTQIDTSVAGGKSTSSGANWMKATNFGQPQGPTDYQQPRTFYISFGVRF